MSGKQELLEQIGIMEELAEANVCRMNDTLLHGMAEGLRALISREYHRGFSKEDVARYYCVSTRTLERWRERYEDFPMPAHRGTKEVSYDCEDIVKWKKAHLDLFTDK